ncbi:MAG: hypothetical protein M2R45_05011 [Verrucomicrobia subdivision 3 bacterium]|nr:hypothetical protein [Limisphaerales bacterium]MCS1417662.1 hypothetical protein [Limisphaerales bacterium]
MLGNCIISTTRVFRLMASGSSRLFTREWDLNTLWGSRDRRRQVGLRWDELKAGEEIASVVDETNKIYRGIGRPTGAILSISQECVC